MSEIQRERLTWTKKEASRGTITLTSKVTGDADESFVRSLQGEFEDSIMEGTPPQGFTIMLGDTGADDIYVAPSKERGLYRISWAGSRERKVLGLFKQIGAVVSMDKTAAVASGMYGFKKAVQRDVESMTNRMQKKATAIAQRIFAKDPEVVPFLQKHAKTRKSKSAKMILAAMKNIGPKLASEKVAGASPKGLYGFNHKTAEMGLHACSELRLAGGQMIADLHGRRGEDFSDIHAFLKKHSSEGKCIYSNMLLDCCPDMPEPLVIQASLEDVWVF